MDFEDIRPYRDEEVSTAIQELIQEEQFKKVVGYLFPDQALEDVLDQLSKMDKINLFQEKIILPTMSRIIGNSISELSVSGIDQLQKDQNYLFISTHRDIVMDSALMNVILKQHGHDTAEIAIGDNLMTIPWVVKLVKLNKSFIVKRDLPNDQKLKESLRLSAYINASIKKEKKSIWLAQKSGRSKGGDDRTNPSILKMLLLSNDKEALESIKELNICPVSIAYEYNPCDSLFLPELIANMEGREHVKSKTEDVEHMALGIEGYKGKVEVRFSTPINKQLEQLEGVKNRNELLALISKQIDQSLHRDYSMLSSNYIAHDLLFDSQQFEHKYTSEKKEKFMHRLELALDKEQASSAKAKELFLKMYAQPLINQLQLKIPTVD